MIQIKAFGGEGKELKNNNFNLPNEIDLLFENNLLGSIKLLQLIVTFQNVFPKKKNYSINELIFYYSLVNFNLLEVFETKGAKIHLNQYYKFQKEISVSLLHLSSFEYINVLGKVTSNLKEVKIELTKSGLIFFDKLDLTGFNELKSEYVYVLENIKFTPNNLKKIKEYSK